MLRALRATLVIMIGACIIAGSAGCWPLPNVPKNPPVSLQVAKGKAMIAWCGEEVVLTKIQVFYFRTEVEEEDGLVYEATMNQAVDHGAPIRIDRVSNDWHVVEGSGMFPPAGTREISLNLYFTKEGKAGVFTVLPQFKFPRGFDAESWPGMLWLRTGGEYTPSACG